MAHVCRVLSSPWTGIYATEVHSSRHYERHWHTTFGIGIMERGAHRSMSGRGVVDAYAGDVITSNPGEVHDGRPLGGPSRRWRMVYVDATVMAAICHGPGIASGDVQFARPVIRDAALASRVWHLLRRLERWPAATQPSTDQAFACEESLVQACGLALQRYSSARPRREARADLSRVRDALADAVCRPPSLAQLAAAAGVSKYQLLRRFARAYGITPHGWVRQIRVERVRDAITRGATLAQAASGCGFADQSHMTRAFGRHFGFTPGAWQRAVR
jgi:AraC-like DNA-binding protein